MRLACFCAFQIRHDIQTCLTALCSVPLSDKELGRGVQHPHMYLLSLLLSSLPVPGVTPRCFSPVLSTAFELTAALLAKSCEGWLGSSPDEFLDTLVVLVKRVLDVPVVESRASDAADYALVGTMSLVAVLVSKSARFQSSVGSSSTSCFGLIRYVSVVIIGVLGLDLSVWLPLLQVLVARVLVFAAQSGLNWSCD